jgi:hypothetical protein
VIIRRSGNKMQKFSTCEILEPLSNLSYSYNLIFSLLDRWRDEVVVRQPRSVHASFERELPLNFLWTFPRDTFFYYPLISTCLPVFQVSAFWGVFVIKFLSRQITSDTFMHINYILFLTTLFIKLLLHCLDRLLEMNSGE